MTFISTETLQILTHVLWTIKIENHVHRPVGPSQHPSVKIHLDTKIPLSPQVGLTAYTYWQPHKLQKILPSVSMECSLAIPLSFSFLHAFEGMSITRALCVFILQCNVPSLHCTRTVISHRSCAPQYNIEEICFNVCNKISIPGVTYSPQVLVRSLGYIIRKKLPPERTAELLGSTLDWTWRKQ